MCLGRNRKTKTLELLGSWGFFGGDLGLSVGERNVQFLGSVDDRSSGSLGNVGSDFSGVDSVVHQQDLEVAEISDVESLQAILQAVSRLLNFCCEFFREITGG